jgi:hypothetical protein
MTFGAWAPTGKVIYIPTTPDRPSKMSPSSPRFSGRRMRPLPTFAIAACLAVALLGGCKKGEGADQGGDQGLLHGAAHLSIPER